MNKDCSNKLPVILTIKVGDIVEDRYGQILVENIHDSTAKLGFLWVAFYGPELHKGGTRKRNGVKRSVFLRDLKSWRSGRAITKA